MPCLLPPPPHRHYIDRCIISSIKMEEILYGIVNVEIELNNSVSKVHVEFNCFIHMAYRYRCEG